ncbi:hypothetical protein LX92_00900 [Maribacter polysiphoniae]|uniref:Uncharacterized protein n=1 Tax=Maribacter polysiphoniae TaxID=429344 RepID=A0A316E396_9FLAO|nr:hypothetical protein LX92_00900 [Maribacter polysiphoniae]
MLIWQKGHKNAINPYNETRLHLSLDKETPNRVNINGVNSPEASV